jgi:hypothetical protein
MIRKESPTLEILLRIEEEMQRNGRKLRGEELQLTKVILAAPFEETSERTVRKEPFVDYGLIAGGSAREKSQTLFEKYGFRPQIVLQASH